MADLIPLGDVWAYLHDDVRPGASNSGIVIDEDGLTVIDAQLTPQRGHELLAAIESFGLPVRRLALTLSLIHI